MMSMGKKEEEEADAQTHKFILSLVPIFGTKTAAAAAQMVSTAG
jgi:hypothetical protein